MTKLSPLASVSATREVLEAHGLATKKALGQNFLISDGVLIRIIELAEVNEQDFVLEVGPGIGTLTIALLKHAGQVLSIERDKDLPAVLAQTCEPWADHFTLISGDALALTEADLLSTASGCLPNKFVSNLPYAVAATLVLDYFEHFESLDSAIVMVQAEVADRMCAKPGTKTYGAYTVKLRLYAEPVSRFTVSPGNFFPPPRVNSAVLRLDRHVPVGSNGVPLAKSIIRATATMADASFTNRRKTIANSCKTYFAGKGEEGVLVTEHLPAMFEQACIDPIRRGETLDLSEFILLGEALDAVLSMRSGTPGQQ